MSDRRVTSLLSDGMRMIQIEEHRVGARRALITVAGEVDHSTLALLQSALARAWETRPVAVAVDLRQVSFINTGGLRALLLASGTARARRVPLILQAGPGQVSKLLTMVGLGKRMLSPGGVRAELATGSSESRPVLRLVGPTDISNDPRPPGLAAPVTGQGSRGYLRSVRAPSPAHLAGDHIVAQHVLGSYSPMRAGTARRPSRWSPTRRASAIAEPTTPDVRDDRRTSRSARADGCRPASNAASRRAEP